MTDISYDPTDPATQQETSRLSPGVRQALDNVGAAIHAKNVAETHVAKLERDLAIERAGIPDIPAKELFIKVYDGESTREAVRAEAARYGLLSPENVAAAANKVPAAQQRDIDLDAAFAKATSPAEVMRIAREAGLEKVVWQ